MAVHYANYPVLPYMQAYGGFKLIEVCHTLLVICKHAFLWSRKGLWAVPMCATCNCDAEILFKGAVTLKRTYRNRHLSSDGHFTTAFIPEQMSLSLSELFGNLHNRCFSSLPKRLWTVSLGGKMSWVNGAIMAV